MNWGFVWGFFGRGRKRRKIKPIKHQIKHQEGYGFDFKTLIKRLCNHNCLNTSILNNRRMNFWQTIFCLKYFG